MNPAPEVHAPSIVPRRPAPHVRAATPRAWFAGDPYRTQVFHGMSLGFPSGEQFFVDSVRAFRARIGEGRLADDVRAFISQEMHHSRAHAEFNAWVRAENPAAAALEEKATRDIDVMRSLAPEVQLAITCALEHFTAVLAESLLESPEVFEAMHPDVRALWAWHALEESEHKSVAFDVYQSVCGRYGLRAAVMVSTTVLFLRDLVAYQLVLLRGEGIEPEPAEVVRSVLQLVGPKGPFRTMPGRWLEYFRPGFHPRRDGDAARLERARALYEQLRAARAQMS